MKVLKLCHVKGNVAGERKLYILNDVDKLVGIVRIRETMNVDVDKPEGPSTGRILVTALNVCHK